MTQKMMGNKERLATQADFLRVLYPQVSQDIWLELRCIHPATGEVRALWIQMGNETQQDSVLKQAEKLNSEGFSIYFAPCLRKEKKGSAASAVLLPSGSVGMSVAIS